MADLASLLRSALGDCDTVEVDQYLRILRENGYHNPRLAGKFLTQEELLRIGVTKTGHARAILEALLRQQRTTAVKKHVFYVSHDKAEAGTEAAMFDDVAALRYRETPAFIDSNHAYMRTRGDFLNAMLASNFVVFLLTPGFLLNPRCLAELVWAHESKMPNCMVRVERPGLEQLTIFPSMDPNELISRLTVEDWSTLSAMEISTEQVFSAVDSLIIQVPARPTFTFRPHEARELRAAFFSVLFRFMDEFVVVEAGSQLFGLDQRVEVRWRKGERWYTGRVTEVALNGTYSILYDDGDRESGVTAQYMQAYQSPPVVVFQQDDRVEARWKRRNAFFPGRIVAAYENLNAYDIVYDDGDIEYRVSYELIRRIGQA